MFETRSLPVRLAATVMLIPTALKDVALAIPEAAKGFAENVKDEMDDRKKIVNILRSM